MVPMKIESVAMVCLAVIGGSSGCAGAVIERVNYVEPKECTGDRAPVMESVGGKVVAICIAKPVAELVICARSIAVAGDVSSFDRKSSGELKVPKDLGGGKYETSQSGSATITYSEATPLLVARAEGLNACRRNFEVAAKVGADANAIALGQAQQRTAAYAVCMGSLKELNQPGETTLRDTIALACKELLVQTKPGVLKLAPLRDRPPLGDEPDNRPTANRSR